VPRILLVDDDIAEISTVKRVLLRAGHQAVLATNAGDAERSLAGELPAAALVSATCDDGAALELLGRLLGEERSAALPVILLGESATAPPGVVQLPRPIDPFQLADHLGAALKAPSAPAEAPPATKEPARFSLTALSAGSQVPGPGEPIPRDERRAAADALRQRAEELRRSGTGRIPAAPSAAEIELEPPARDAEELAEEELRRLGEEGSRREAEERARAHAAAQTRADAVLRQVVAEQGRAPEEPARVQSMLSAQIDEELSRLAEEAQGEGQREADERARAEAEEEMRAEAEASLAEAERRAAEERQRAEERRKRAQAEEARRRAESEAAARAEEARRRAEEHRKQAEAEAVARAAEEEARRELADRRAARAAAEEAARRRAREAKAEREAPPAAPPEPPAPPRDGTAAPEPEPPVAPEVPPPPAELARGSLAETPAPRLLALAARHRLTGRLDFTGEAPRSLYFEEGRVVGATSGAPHERVEELALRLGLVTREQHRQAATGSSGLPTRRAAMVLLDRGFLKPTELTPLVRRRTEEVVFALFLDQGGSFAWTPGRVPAEERIALERGTLALAIEGVRRKWLDPQLQGILGSPATVLGPAAQAPPGVELGLSPGEQRLLALADGLRTVEEIVADSPLDPLATRQCLTALVVAGVLSLRYQAGPEARSAGASIDLARVREKLDQVRRADYFAILGLPRHSTPYEIREAADRLAAEFDPARYTGSPEPGLAERLREILDVVAEAREVLSDDTLRGEYLAGLGDES